MGECTLGKREHIVSEVVKKEPGDVSCYRLCEEVEKPVENNQWHFLEVYF